MRRLPVGVLVLAVACVSEPEPPTSAEATSPQEVEVQASYALPSHTPARFGFGSPASEGRGTSRGSV